MEGMKAFQVDLGPRSTQEIAQFPKQAAGHDTNGPAGGQCSFVAITSKERAFLDHMIV